MNDSTRIIIHLHQQMRAIYEKSPVNPRHVFSHMFQRQIAILRETPILRTHKTTHTASKTNKGSCKYKNVESTNCVTLTHSWIKLNVCGHKHKNIQHRNSQYKTIKSLCRVGASRVEECCVLINTIWRTSRFVTMYTRTRYLPIILSVVKTVQE